MYNNWKEILKLFPVILFSEHFQAQFHSTDIIHMFLPQLNIQPYEPIICLFSKKLSPVKTDCKNEIAS